MIKPTGSTSIIQRHTVLTTIFISNIPALWNVRN